MAEDQVCQSRRGSGQRAQQQLRLALASQDLIGQAKGILMERYQLNAHDAFVLLILAQRVNRTLPDAAEELVTTGDLTHSAELSHITRGRPGLLAVTRVTAGAYGATVADAMMIYQVAYTTTNEDTAHIIIAAHQDDAAAAITACGKHPHRRADFLPADLSLWRMPRARLCPICLDAAAKSVRDDA